LANKLSVSTQTTNSRGGKNFEYRLNEPHTLITVGVSLFLEQPPQDGNGDSFVDYAYTQDVVAMLAQLPQVVRSRLNTQGWGSFNQPTTIFAISE
jgi:hypothetical protein